jgi:hypothetical protein
MEKKPFVEPYYKELLEQNLDGQTNFGIEFQEGMITCPFGDKIFKSDTVKRTRLQMFSSGQGCHVHCLDVKPGTSINICHAKRLLIRDVEMWDRECVLIVTVMM